MLRVRKDRLDEYKRRHADVWPEMRKALRDSGWRNYSLFLQPDGVLIGYFETQDLREAHAAMKKLPVNERWQAEMTPFFESLDGRQPDEQMRAIEEIFHLD